MPIQLEEHGPYYEGDYIDIPHKVVDSAEVAVDLTDATVTFLLKENVTDEDVDALLTKSGTESGTGDEVTFTDPTNGEATIHIETGDTDGVLTEDTTRFESDTFYFTIRVTDSSGRRVSTAVGTWEITAS